MILMIIISSKLISFFYTNSWQPIIDFINEKYDQYFKDESGLNRRNIEDHRVHCCLYFVNPSGHGYDPLLIKFILFLFLFLLQS